MRIPGRGHRRLYVYYSPRSQRSDPSRPLSPANRRFVQCSAQSFATIERRALDKRCYKCFCAPEFDGESRVSYQADGSPCFQNNRSPKKSEHFHHSNQLLDCRIRAPLYAVLAYLWNSRICSPQVDPEVRYFSYWGCDAATFQARVCHIHEV